MAIINHDRIKAELLHFYCATHWGFDVVAVEFSGNEGLAAVIRTKPDFVLVSLGLHDLGALEIISQVSRVSPASKIIGQTTRCNDYLLHMLTGADYHGLFLDTDESLVSLGQTIDRVRQGLRAVSPQIARCQTTLRTNPASFPKLLSQREQQVLVCIGHALSDDEIARQLNMSSVTAVSHRKKIMGKLGIHSTPKLIRFCADKGFNSVPPPGLVQSKDSP